VNSNHPNKTGLGSRIQQPKRPALGVLHLGQVQDVPLQTATSLQRGTLLSSPSTCLYIVNFCLWFIFLSQFYAFAQPLTAASDSLSVVQRVVQLYEAGRLSEAEFMALKALDDRPDLARYDRFELYRVLAFCAIANDDEVNGARHFIQALRLNPNLSPDPITWSPKVRRVFETARGEFLRITVEETRQRVAAEAEFCRKASLRSLYLPGAGQFDKGQPQRGVVYAAAFGISAVLFIYAEINLPKARDRYRQAQERQVIDREYRTYRNLYRLERIAGSMLIISYSAPFFDALWRAPAVKETQDKAK